MGWYKHLLFILNKKGMKPERVLEVLKLSGWNMKKVGGKVDILSKKVSDDAYTGLEREEIDDNISNVIVFVETD